MLRMVLVLLTEFSSGVPPRFSKVGSPMLNYAPIDTYRRMLQALNALSRDQVCG